MLLFSLSNNSLLPPLVLFVTTHLQAILGYINTAPSFISVTTLCSYQMVSALQSEVPKPYKPAMTRQPWCPIAPVLHLTHLPGFRHFFPPHFFTMGHYDRYVIRFRIWLWVNFSFFGSLQPP